MKKTIMTCDRCKQETEWLYNMPTITIEGLALEIGTNPIQAELCIDCAKRAIAAYKRETGNEDYNG